jgi:hypothetical protein
VQRPVRSSTHPTGGPSVAVASSRPPCVRALRKQAPIPPDCLLAATSGRVPLTRAQTDVCPCAPSRSQCAYRGAGQVLKVDERSIVRTEHPGRSRRLRRRRRRRRRGRGQRRAGWRRRRGRGQRRAGWWPRGRHGRRRHGRRRAGRRRRWPRRVRRLGRQRRKFRPRGCRWSGRRMWGTRPRRTRR